MKNLQKKIQATESAYDVCTEDLFNQTIKLEEMEKKASNAEGQVDLQLLSCHPVPVGGGPGQEGSAHGGELNKVSLQGCGLQAA